VRIGRRVEIEFAGEADLDLAREIADKLLANPVIEDFTLRTEEDPQTDEAAADADADARGGSGRP
jgi:phosphoribosylformylglycinamidine synthase